MASVICRSGLKHAKSSFLSNSMRRMAVTTNTAPIDKSEDINWANARPYEEIPGPKPLPIIGNLHQFIPGIGDMGERELMKMWSNLYKKYGKILKVTNIPGRPDMVMVFDPKAIEEVYRNEGPWPERDGLQSLTYYKKVHRKDFYKGVGGLLVESGEDWKKFRTKVNPTMMQPRAVNMYLKPIIEVANDFVERTKTLRDSKSEMPDDYVNELNKWALESIAMIALDTRLGCLESNLKKDSEPQKMIDAVENFFAGLEILDMRPPLWKIISTPTWRRYVKALDYFTDVSMKYINDAMKRMKERPPGVEYEASVLEKILLRDPDPKTACVMALDMLMAGVDTTSFSVASMLYNLSKNPDKQEYLLKEIVRYLPNKDKEITISEIEDMKYLKACIKENMRLRGIAVGNMRGTTKEVVIGNYRIPKNVNIMMPHLLLGRLEESFPKADKFIPERWLKSRPGDADSIGSAEDYDFVHGFNTNPFVFLPFGFGPRMCIGKRFAELEMEVLSIKMVRNFKVEYDYGNMEYTCKLLHKPLSPLKFKLTDRNC